MSKRDDIKRIYRESFRDSEEYVRMIFDSVYKDAEGLILNDPDGNPASSMLLRKYEMTFHGAVRPVSYIFGAATKRAQRGKGFMSRLIREALRLSAERGDMICTLIPANESLYYFYSRLGFSKVFYMKEQRFTSLHSFRGAGDFEVIDDPDTDMVWEAFNRFQRQRGCYVMHSAEDFRTILEDNRLDGGDFVVMGRHDEDLGLIVAAMVWAVKKDDLILVTDLMGESVDARLAAMRQLRGIHSDMPFLLYGRPSDKMGGRLMPRGMGRIVNVGMCLEAIAAENPKLNIRIRVTDSLLPERNSHIYLLSDGKLRIDDTYHGRLDFDVTVEVLARIVFNSAEVGEIIGFPSMRPMISLMLD